ESRTEARTAPPPARVPGELETSCASGLGLECTGPRPRALRAEARSLPALRLERQWGHDPELRRGKPARQIRDGPVEQEADLIGPGGVDREQVRQEATPRRVGRPSPRVREHGGRVEGGPVLKA